MTVSPTARCWYASIGLTFLLGLELVALQQPVHYCYILGVGSLVGELLLRYRPAFTLDLHWLRCPSLMTFDLVFSVSQPVLF